MLAVDQVPETSSVLTAMWHLGVSLAIGLLVGLERERNHPSSFAGVRTFGAASLASGVAAAISPYAGAAVLLGISALTYAGYRRGIQADGDRGATTEVALIAAAGLGALAWTQPVLAAGTGVVLAVILAAKSPLHRFARRQLTDLELQDALIFFVAAFVVLPLLPSEQWGPYGVIDPRRIWLVVVALAGIGWVGYIAMRIIGPERGLLVTGLAGGFVSASATTGAMGQFAKSDVKLRQPALAASVIANVSTLLQMLVVTAVASVTLARALIPAAAAGIVALVLVAVVVVRRTPPLSEEAQERLMSGRPMHLKAAIVLALVLTAAVLAARWGAEQFGSSGILAATALAGLADAHAGGLAAATMLTDGQVTLSVALVGAGIAMLSNLFVKIVVAFAAGGAGFAVRLAGLLAVPSVVVGIALWLSAT